jgi:DNA-binding CsgD family transcriptional regulator
MEGLMDRKQDEQKSRQNWVLTQLFLIMIALVIWDIHYDLTHGIEVSHMLKESLCAIMGLVGIFVIWYRSVVPLEGALRLTEKNRRSLEVELQQFRNSIAPFTSNIRQEVERQFSAWNLTAAEKETAFLLLKGLSLKEIANVRNVSEKTVKQQNLVIYQKSGLAGRAELSAFFLEDLLAI